MEWKKRTRKLGMREKRMGEKEKGMGGSRPLLVIPLNKFPVIVYLGLALLFIRNIMYIYSIL